METFPRFLTLCVLLLYIYHSAAGNKTSCRTPGFFVSPDGTWCLHLSSERQNFAASSVFCQAYNATLVTLDTMIKQNQVEQFIVETYGTFFEMAYIGAVNILSDRPWMWYQRNKMLHTNWDKDEPVNKTGYACAVMRLGWQDFKWHAVNCLHEKRYMCQKEGNHYCDYRSKCILKNTADEIVNEGI